MFQQLVCVVLLSLCLVQGDQVHLAYAGGGGVEHLPPDAMAVSWHTIEKIDTPVVQYGTDKDMLNQSSSGLSKSYWAESYHHHAVMNDLLPSTLYYYTVTDDERILSFMSPTFDQPKKPLHIAMIGDMGIYESAGTMAALNRIANDVDFIYHLGDMAYADDAFYHHPLKFYYEITWDTYMNEVESFTSIKPYMVMPGNHEATCYSPVCQLSAEKSEALSNFTAYRNRFRMPYVESDGTDNMWHSFDVSNVHFVSIDTETDYPHAPNDPYSVRARNGGFGDQMAWLRKDLEQAIAAKKEHKTDWIIVGGHRPIYTISRVDKNDDPEWAPKALQKAIEDMLIEFNVDVYFCGHIHGYERHYPTYKSVPLINGTSNIFTNPGYPIHVINGGAGNTEKLQKEVENIPVWNAVHNYEDYGYGTLDFDERKLVWKYFDDSDNLLDEFTIIKTLF